MINWYILLSLQATLSRWLKWNGKEPAPDNRTSGSVCGQDPRFCQKPFSKGSYTWPDDITKWPVRLTFVWLLLHEPQMRIVCRRFARKPSKRRPSTST